MYKSGFWAYCSASSVEIDLLLQYSISRLTFRMNFQTAFFTSLLPTALELLLLSLSHVLLLLRVRLIESFMMESSTLIETFSPSLGLVYLFVNLSSLFFVNSTLWRISSQCTSLYGGCPADELVSFVVNLNVAGSPSFVAL